MTSVLNMEETRNIQLSGKHGGVAKVSAVDFDRVSKYRWRLYSGYANSDNVGTMHKFVLGERPENIPQDWVIDHKNRDKLNNSQSNLRFVPQSFNNWNVPIIGTSRYKSVSWEKSSGKWRARFIRKHLGFFDDERKAGWASAKEAIREWGSLAAESDLLVAPDLFSKEDVKKMQEEISNETEVVVKVRELPVGVYLHKKKYQARHCHKSLGTYKTILEAQQAYETHVKSVQESAWNDHCKLDITRDDDGDAVITLSGKKGTGKFAKVSDEFWHKLTFQKSWSYSGKYASGKWIDRVESLHTVIYKMLNPEYVYSGDNSIDHINRNKLDNRSENLREATNSEQGKNKGNGGTSKYTGIFFSMSQQKWIGQMRVEGKRYGVCGKTENEAAKKLNEKQRKLLGDKATLITIVE